MRDTAVMPKSKSTKKKARASVAKPKRDVVKVRTDPARQRRYDELAKAMRGARLGEARGFDAYWESVGEVIDAQLYIEGGYSTADAWMKAVVHEPKRTALRNVRVARYASPDEESRWGVTKLDAALSFIEAKLGAPIAGKLPIKLDALRIPVERDGKKGTRGLDDVDAAEIAVATKRLRRVDGTERARRSPIEPAYVDAIQKVAGLRGMSVRFHDGRISFGNVPMSQLEPFKKILREVDWESALPK